MKRINTPELAKAFIDEQLKTLREQIGDKKVLLALSGGVDSSVVAALLIKAVGKQLVCVHVNHGLLRKGEPEQVIEVFRNQMNANLVYVDATDRFLDKLAGVAEPEKKRKIIGAEFIRVFEEEARKLDGIEFLAQGTICLLYTSNNDSLFFGVLNKLSEMCKACVAGCRSVSSGAQMHNCLSDTG